jgi:hypothetical protein
MIAALTGKHRRRAYPALVALLALLAHLAVMALPGHAQAMNGDPGHAHPVARGVIESADQSEPALPAAPVRPHWNACGFEAAPPVHDSPRMVSTASSADGQTILTSQPQAHYCFVARDPDPPPEDRLALLRVFRL